ncbi:MAG: hypothetical protein HYZ49_03050 [Chloroflexi bacterium]|nr:hypothetical protein [Chloroflexota bacterium]
MLHNKRHDILWMGLLILAIALTACAAPQSAANDVKDYGFIVKGVSGKNVMLDRTWYRECAPSGVGTWMKSMRTLSGYELATTMLDYQNESETPDCANGITAVTIFVQTLTNDHALVPITWVDLTGQPADPPAGLEDVKEANAASGVVTFATLTPLTQAKADELNAAAFCGISNWAPGVTEDLLPCFSFGGPAKGVIIVDDRTETGAVYDGISINPAEYPTLMPNVFPHTGPLNGFEFGDR